MVFWAKELIELAKKVSDKMESIDAPTNENGEVIAGTDEVKEFNKYAFALMDCNSRLKELLKEDTNENQTVWKRIRSNSSQGKIL